MPLKAFYEEVQSFQQSSSDTCTIESVVSSGNCCHILSNKVTGYLPFCFNIHTRQEMTVQYSNLNIAN